MARGQRDGHSGLGGGGRRFHRVPREPQEPAAEKRPGRRSKTFDPVGVRGQPHGPGPVHVFR